MTFNLFSSNEQNQLLDALVTDLIESPLSNPFDPDILVVPNHGMQRWLSIQLASKIGIAANHRFHFPNELLDTIFQFTVEDYQKPQISGRDHLLWIIYFLLPKIAELTSFQEIRHYIQSGNDFKVFQFSKKLAGLFDQYSMYRPAWILSNEQKANEEDWQKELWNIIYSQFQINLAPHWVKKLKQNNNLSLKNQLPSRISIFGISNLTPLHLEVIDFLSKFTTINFYFLNPSMEYWVEIQSPKTISKKKKKSPEIDQYLDEGNRLLAYLANVGREFFGNMIQNNLIDDFGTDFFRIKESPESLLEHIQDDIFHLQNPTPPKSVSNTDYSVQIHSCHSPMREVEVLHDQILNLLDLDPELNPSDIIVMMPDIEKYATLILAVFSQDIRPGEQIPLTIADRIIVQKNPILQGLFKILELVKGQFTRSEILDLLDLTGIQKNFNFSEKDVEKLKIWITDANIKWGIDADHRADLGAPAIHETSWEFGIERILTGFAIPLNEAELFKISDKVTILPYDHVNGQDTEIFGIFLDLFNKLKLLVKPGKNCLLNKRTLTDWGIVINQLIDEFFNTESEWDSELEIVYQFLERINLIDQLLENPAAVDFEVFIHYLRSELEEQKSSYGFLGAGVTFCSMLPMRTIPAKVVMLMGMNESDFPRKNRSLSFDLMTKNKRQGDRSIKDEDRYMFLEAILSVKQFLYLSYVGQSIHDNTTIPPSIVITELLDYIETGYQLPEGSLIDQIVCQHALQAFNPKYFDPEEPRFFSYSNENLKAITQKKSQNTLKPFITNIKTDIPTSISAIDLTAFFNNPSKYLLKHQLGIHLETQDNVISDQEAFAIDSLIAYQIQTSILEQCVKQENVSDYQEILYKGGKIPLGAAGEKQYRSLEKETIMLLDQIKTLGNLSNKSEIAYTISIEGNILKGILGITDHKIVHYYPSKLKPVHYLRLWIEQAIYLKQTGNTIEVFVVAKAPSSTSTNKKLVLVTSQVKEENLTHLNLLVRYFIKGLSSPLAFFQKTIIAYLDSIHKDVSPELSLLKAIKCWHSSDFNLGEYDDPYIQKCFKHTDLVDTDFIQIGSDIICPVLDSINSTTITI